MNERQWKIDCYIESLNKNCWVSWRFVYVCVCTFTFFVQLTSHKTKSLVWFRVDSCVNVWKKTLVANNTDFNGIILAKINYSLLFVCLECLVCTPLNLIQPWSKLLMSLFLSFFCSFCSYEPNCVGNSLCQQQAHRLLLLLTNSNLSSIFYRFPSIQFQFLWDVCVCLCVYLCKLILIP